MRAFLLLLLSLCCVQRLNAQFLFDYERSSYFVPHTNNGSILGFTVLASIEGGEQGFVFFYKPEGSLSSFHPDEIRGEECEVVFLTFGENFPSRIYLSNGKKIEIKGPIRFKFAELDIYFDPRAPQRLTSVSFSEGTETFVSAFSNIENILNQKDDTTKKLSSVLLPNAPEEFQYKNRALYAQTVEFVGDSIGIRTGSRNPCLFADTLVLTYQDAQALKSNEPLSESARRSFGALRKGEYVNTIENDYILLSVTDERVIVFEPKNGNAISSVVPLGASGYESVCVINKL